MLHPSYNPSIYLYISWAAPAPSPNRKDRWPCLCLQVAQEPPALHSPALVPWRELTNSSSKHGVTTKTCHNHNHIPIIPHLQPEPHTPPPKNREKWEIGKKNAATLDQRTTSGAGGPASFTGGAASPVSGPSVGAWLWTKQKASAVSFAPPFMTGHHFYSMSWSSFCLLVLSISSVQCLISNATWSLTRPPAPNHTFPSLVEGARLSVAYKEIIGNIRELITKEHASSGRWNLKELLLNHKAKLPRNKQIKFHEILIDSAY